MLSPEAISRGLEGFLKTYLVAASGVVEFTEGGLVAVGHVSTAAEEHQSAGIVH